MAKLIELFKVRPGEVFGFAGMEFVKLGEELGDTFVLARDVVMKDVPFENEGAERKDHNNYSGSYLEKQCERWLRDEHPAILDAAAEHPIDLTTMDGLTDYGAPLALVRALTIDEYRKYRRFIPPVSELFWLATGYTTASNRRFGEEDPYRFLALGSAGNGIVYAGHFAARPALYLKSSVLVAVDDGQEGKGLGDYTELELLGELQRRTRFYEEGGERV